MKKWLLSRLKWIIAGKEMEELHRWRSFWEQTDRWFAEFKEAEAALTYLKAKAEGTYTKDIPEIRNNFRKKKNDLFGNLAALRKCALFLAYDNGMVNVTTTESEILHQMFLSLVNGSTIQQIYDAEKYLALKSDDFLEKIMTGVYEHVDDFPPAADHCINIIFNN